MMGDYKYIMERFKAVGEEIKAEAGSILFRAGEMADNIYLQKKEGSHIRLYPGLMPGIDDFVLNRPHQVDYKVGVDCIFLKISKNKFLKLFASDFNFKVALLKAMCQLPQSQPRSFE